MPTPRVASYAVKCETGASPHRRLRLPFRILDSWPSAKSSALPNSSGRSCPNVIELYSVALLLSVHFSVSKIPKSYVRLLLSCPVFAGVPFAGGAIITRGQRLMCAALVWVMEYLVVPNENGEPAMPLANCRCHQGRSYRSRSTIAADGGYAMFPRHRGRRWLVLTS